MEHHQHQNINGITESNSSAKWTGICIALGVVVLIAITIFKIPIGTVITGAIFLACPLMHIAMMRNGGHKH